MSNAEADEEVESSGSEAIPRLAKVEVLSPRPVFLGPRQEVRRVLPNRNRRMIGAWCFVDHYGPEDIGAQPGMRVPPHPHTGLQTVSWLLAGEVEHHDSLGSAAVVVPGELNLMTAGSGIAHSEVSPAGHDSTLHGLQLWVALPGSALAASRDFTQYRSLPVIELPGLQATVLLGELAGAASPAATFTPIVGAELVVDGDVTLPLRPEFEYGVLSIDGGILVEGQPLELSEIAYVGGDRTTLALSSPGRARRAFLLGGAPFEEDIVMWWNFIGRTHEDIVEARRVWNDELAGLVSPVRFGVVEGFDGNPLVAPPMPNARLRARGRHGPRPS